AWIVIKRSQFQFTKGTPHRYQTETGAWRTFCPHCGTSLTYEHNKRADEIDITTGSLDHPEDFSPTKDVYPEERLRWVELPGAEAQQAARGVLALKDPHSSNQGPPCRASSLPQRQ